MSDLMTIQKDFIEKVFTYKACPKNIASPYALERFHVYRQSIFENCRSALLITFPYVWKILKEKNIVSNEVVGHFLKEPNHWPSSGCLDDWGDLFPNFIESFFQSTALKDLAQYEWLCNLASMQPELPCLSAMDLTKQSEQEQMNVRFHFQPSFFIHYTSFPLGRFIEGLSESLPCWIVVLHSDSQIVTYKIEEEWGAFFKALQDGKTISDAYEKTLSQYPYFNLTTALAFLLEKKLCKK